MLLLDRPVTGVSFSLRRHFLIPVVVILLLVITSVGTHFLDLKLREISQSRHLHPGPWGELIEWDIRIHQPDEYLSFGKLSDSGPLWNFGAISLPALNHLLLSVGLTGEQAEKLGSMRLDDPMGNFVIRPDEEMLLSIPSEVRSRLYRELAAIPSNRFQVNPFYVPEGNFWKLLDGGKVFKPEIPKLFAKLSYNRNGYTYFSDPETVLSHLPNPDDREIFLRMLTSQRAVLLKLRIRPETDLSKILFYWSASEATHLKDISPLLEAERQLPEGGVLSILFFLPPLAREVLYTTPISTVPNPLKLPDCHWSSLNFFAENPDDRMRDETFASKYIADHYYQIGKPGIVGDLALFINPRNQVIHSAVYLADDVYFTKNGVDIAVPWILMREKDLLGSYSALDPVKVVYFRKLTE